MEILGLHKSIYFYILAHRIKALESALKFCLLMSGLGAVHKLRHFKIDLYGSSNNDST